MYGPYSCHANNVIDVHLLTTNSDVGFGTNLLGFHHMSNVFLSRCRRRALV
jgi:hypothetical protein